MVRLSFALLGPPEVRRDEQPLKLRTRKELGLLAYLAAVPGQQHSREELSALFWPESPKPRSRTSLRGALSGLHLVFPDDPDASDGSPLLIDRASVGLRFTPEMELDLHAVQVAFELAQQMPETALLQNKASEADIQSDIVERLHAAVDLYRGEFLQDLSILDAPDFEYWVSLERETWRSRMDLIFERLLQLHLKDGQSAEAIRIATRWITHNPLNEYAYRRLMESQLAAGDRTGALHTYETLRSTLDRELDAEPGSQTEALADSIRSEPPSKPIFERSEEAVGIPPSRYRNPLVGRTDELGVLASEFFSTSQDGARVVTVLGESGIGKTRLVREFLAWASAQKGDILRGKALQSCVRLPYGAIVDALRSRVDRERAPDDLLSDTWLSELGRLLPELRDRYPDLPLRTADEAAARTRLFESVVRLMQALADIAPIVLFIDDIHWADRASLDILHYAAGRWTKSGTPILLVLCFNTEAIAADPTLEDWISELGYVSNVRRLALQNLSREEVLQLVRDLVPEHQNNSPQYAAAGGSLSDDLEKFGEWLYGETDGQPLYVAETLEELHQRKLPGLHRWENNGWSIDVQAAQKKLEELRGFVPGGVRSLVQTRLRRLGPEVRALLTAGAVLEHNITFDRLCVVADLTENKGLMALDRALQSRFVREVEENGITEERYEFAHDKIRAAVYAEENTVRRRLFHRRALKALQHTASSSELAHHAFGAKLPEEAFRFSVVAGDEALRLFAAQDAVYHYSRAWDLVGGDSASPSLETALATEDLQHLYSQLGHAYVITTEWEQADRVHQALLALGRDRQKPAVERAALNSLANLVVHRSYDLAEARRLLQQALHIEGADDDLKGLAETEWNFAQIESYAWEALPSLEHGEKAFELASKCGDTELIARSLYAISNSRWRLGQWEEAEARADEALRLYEKLGDRRMEAACLRQVAIARIHYGRPKAGIDAVRSARRISLEIDDVWASVHSTRALALGLVEVGDYTEALRIAQLGVEGARELDHPVWLLITLHALGRVNQAFFRLDDAHEAYSEALDISEDNEIRPYVAAVAAQLCAVRALSGDWDVAYTYALQALEARDLTELVVADFSRWYETEALLRAGRNDEVRQDTRRFGKRVGTNRRYRLPYLRALAVQARWDDDTDLALEYLREAATLALDIGLPGEQWQIESALGELHQSRGEQEKACEAFSRAVDTLEALADGIEDGDVRRSFLAAPQVRRILEQQEALR